jgi:hypothetical protein
MRIRRRIAMAAACGLMVAAPYAASSAGASPHPPWSPVHSPNPAAGAHAINQLAAISCSAGSCLAVGVARAGTVTSNVLLHGSGTTWTKRRPANAFHALGLSGIACVTKKWCMAVGERRVPDKGEIPAAQIITRTNAKNASAGLSTVAVNIPTLNAVSCRSTHFCIAVGSQVGEDSLKSTPIVDRWNGHKWSAMKAPDPGINVSYDGVAPIGVSLSGVRCRSTRSCLAVGTDLKVTSPPPMEQTSSYFTYAMKYNGKKWRTTPTPNVSPTGTTAAPPRPNDVLAALACPSATECFATGDVTITGTRYGFIEKYNGTKWSLSFAEGTVPLALDAIACGSTSSCDAPTIPSSGTATLDLQLLHWGSGSWTEAGTHTPAADSIAALTCPSVAKCTAVGSQPTAGGGDHTLVVTK